MRALLNIFVKDGKSSDSPAVRTRIGKFAAMIGILCNAVLFVGKLLAGVSFGAISVIADAINNLTDASSSIVTLLGFKLSEKPADAEHPFGHARSEYIAGMVVAAMILFVGFELAQSAVEKIISPAAVVFSPVTVVILLFSVAAKLWLAAFYRSTGKLIGSTALQAAAADSRGDVLATGAVLFAAVLEAVTKWQVDGYIGLAVALFILYSGARLVKETIDPLLGVAGSPELREAISAIVCRDPRVLGHHDLLIHDYGPDHCFASIHVEIDRREDPMRCHTLIDRIERECLEKLNVHLVIHYDPIVTDDAELTRLRERVQGILLGFDDGLSLHDFRVTQGKDCVTLIFDVSLPDALQDKKEDIRRLVELALSMEDGRRYSSLITFDPL